MSQKESSGLLSQKVKESTILDKWFILEERLCCFLVQVVFALAGNSHLTLWLGNEQPLCEYEKNKQFCLH